MQDMDRISIENLDISKRTLRALLRSGIVTIGDLKRFSPIDKLLQIHLIGDKSLNEISMALEKFSKNPIAAALPEEKTRQSLIHDEKREGNTNQLPVEVLELPRAIRGMLKKHGIRTVEDLRKTPDWALLRINRIGTKTLRDIRQRLAVVPDNSDAYVKEPTIVEKKIVTWSHIAEDYFRKEKDAYVFVLISRFGYAPKTLEEIATELGVTRERVRQIQEAVAVRYLKHVRLSGAIELLETIEEIFSTHGEELSLSGFEGILIQKSLLGKFSEPLAKGHIKNLDLLETLVCWLNLLSDKQHSLQPIKFSVNISDLVRSGKMSIKDRTTLLNISSKARRQIKRKVLFTGGITIKEATKILSVDERVAVLTLESLNLKKVDKEWFSFEDLEENKDNSKIPLRIAGMKMLAVIPELEIDVFHEGLRKHASRFYSNIAPVHVVSHVLPMLGFNIDSSKISTHLPTKGVLSQSEKALISAINKNQGVASFLEIAEEFFLQRLSLPAVSVTLRRSPIAEKADEGLYKLRGTDISWQQIENAKKRQKRFSQDSEVTHGLDGVVRMKLTVSSYAFLTGVVGSYGIRELSGSWSVTHDGKSFGEAKIDDVYLWGLAKLFKKLDIKIGERIELALNTWNRTLSVEKVKNEHT
jgi:hypothetical protein